MSKFSVLKNPKISDKTNIRILKLPQTESHSILKSLNSNNNLSFIYKPSFVHSFSVYPSNELHNELFRISAPIQYKRINETTNISSYINDIDNSSHNSNPYISFLLGQGKACIAYFNELNEITDWREISRIIQCGKTIKLKYPKSNPIFISDQNLTRFYREVIYKTEKWYNYLNRKSDNFNINNLNISWMSDDRIWNNFWNYHNQLIEKENNNNDIMPFNEFHSNLIRISEYGMGYPRKYDSIRFSHEITQFYCYIDNDYIANKYFPEEIKNLMMDDNLCWDPLKPDITEKRNSRGKRMSAKTIQKYVQTYNEMVDKNETFASKKIRERTERENKKRQQRKQKFDKYRYQKISDLENLLQKSTTSSQSSDNVASV